MCAKSMCFKIMQNMQSDMCRICQVCRIYIDVFSGIPIGMGSSNWHDNCSDICMCVLNIWCKKTQNAMARFCYLFISIHRALCCVQSTDTDVYYTSAPIKHNGHNVGILVVHGKVSTDNRSPNPLASTVSLRRKLTKGSPI